MQNADDQDGDGQEWDDQILQSSQGQSNQWGNISAGLENAHFVLDSTTFSLDF